jgi:hypothetical protein
VALVTQHGGPLLFQEITALGYDGSYPVVRDYVVQHRPARMPLPLAPPTVREVTGWITRPGSLTGDERPWLKAILERRRAPAGTVAADLIGRVLSGTWAAARPAASGGASLLDEMMAA